MSSESERILVSGDVCGKLDTLYERVGKIMKKHGDFSMLLCSGSFFSEDLSVWNKYENESVKGRLGIFSTASGLKIVFLSGLESGDRDYCFNNDDVMKICTLCKVSEPNFQGVDILLTSQWPKGIAKDQEAANPSCLLSNLISKIKPRYIFSGHEGRFYERVPYRNDFQYPLASTVARFIALDKVGSSSKWIYAVDIKKISSDEQSVVNCEPSPFTEELIASLQTPLEKHNQYFFDLKDEHRSKRQKSSHANKFAPKGPCWFCLSSPKSEKHLIISVGDECYLTLAKGGLVEEHFIISSINHCPSMAHASPQLISEISDFQKRIKEYFLAKNCNTIFFERTYRTIHFQMNAIPIPKSTKCDLKKLFMEHAEANHLLMTQISSVDPLKDIKAAQEYFYVELPSQDKLLIQIAGKFPLHFGREVVASKEVLNLPDRILWDKCVLPHEEEKAIADASREAFKNFT